VLSGLNNFEVRAVASCVELVLAESSPTILGLKLFVRLQKWSGNGTSTDYKLLVIIRD
jgi:hypothetical protein